MTQNGSGKLFYELSCKASGTSPNWEALNQVERDSYDDAAKEFAASRRAHILPTLTIQDQQKEWAEYINRCDSYDPPDRRHAFLAGLARGKALFASVSPAWAQDIVIEYQYTDGTHWCPLGPVERAKVDFDGVYRIKPGNIPTEKPTLEVPQGFDLVAVKGFFDLMYWMDRCDYKGHLNNCPDLIEPWAAFECRSITQSYKVQHPAPVDSWGVSHSLAELFYRNSEAIADDLRKLVDGCEQRNSLTDRSIDFATQHLYHNGQPTSKEYRITIARAIAAMIIGQIREFANV